MTLTPEQRSLRARLAVLARWSNEDPSEQMKIARSKFDERFYHQVDPDSLLPPEERERRAMAARKAYFTALAYKRSRARKGKKADL
jgi:hypothetical protein